MMLLIVAGDTLSSQAYGAKNYARVGAITQRGIAVMAALAFPVAFVWYNCDVFLSHLGVYAVICV
jgi:Na+-driven multidrug efflux pump